MKRLLLAFAVVGAGMLSQLGGGDGVRLFAPAAACTAIPQVAAVYPSNGTIAPNGSFLIAEFGLVLGPSNTRVEVAGSAVTGSFTTVAGGELIEPAWVQFVPDADLPAGGAATLIVSTAAGIAATYSRTFAIAAAADTTAPVGGQLAEDFYDFREGGRGYDLTVTPASDDSGEAFVLFEILHEPANETLRRVVPPGTTTITPVSGGMTTCDRQIAEGTTVTVSTVVFDLAGNLGPISSGSFPGDDDIVDAFGCGCATTRTRTSPFVLLGLAALLVRRHRRSRNRTTPKKQQPPLQVVT